MINLIGIEDNDLWDSHVQSIPMFDVYYLSGYVKAFESNGDGKPVLIWWEHENITGACVIMVRDIAEDPIFRELEHGKYFDAITPYGYGGFIFNGNPTDSQIAVLSKELSKSLKECNIISLFFRFHPILKNANYSHNICDVIDLGKTISIDLKDKDTIWSNITSKNRGKIRKAEKLGVEIHHGKGRKLLNIFKDIYESTMKDDNADEYYFFPDCFYTAIDTYLNNNYEIFYASLNGKIISMAIFIFANGQLHYHFSGSLREYRSYSPGNLLLYQVAIWGVENGYKIMHLGGGVGSEEDSLYKFKAAFNRNSDNQFSIGKLIIDPIQYNYLISIREKEQAFDKESNYFPIYRS